MAALSRATMRDVILRSELLRASKDGPHAVLPSFEARRKRRAPPAI